MTGEAAELSGRPMPRSVTPGRGLRVVTLGATRILRRGWHAADARPVAGRAAIGEEEERTQDDRQTQEEFDFYAGKVMSGKFYANFVLPGVLAKCRAIASNDRSALDIPDAGFSTAW